MLPARPSPERPVYPQEGLGFVSLSVGQRVPLRILYGVTSFESGKDYLLVSYHLVPTLAMRGYIIHCVCNHSEELPFDYSVWTS
jgi:hypothetical protein